MDAAFNDAPLLVVGTDATGSITEVLGDARAQFDLPEGELIGRPLVDVAAAYPAVAEGVQQALHGLHRHVHERVNSNDVSVRIDPMHGAHGEIAGCLLVALKGTATDREVPADDTHLRMLVRTVPGAMWATDGNLRITHVSGRLGEAGLFDRSWVVGETVEAVAREVGADPEIVRRHQDALDGRGSAFGFGFRGRSYEIHLDPMRDESGAITGCAGFAIDVTTQQLAERAISESRARLIDAQRAGHVGSWEWRVPENRVSWSEELYRIYGLRQGDFDGTYEGFLAHVLPEDRERTRRVIFDAFRRAGPFEYDHRIVRADGAVRMLTTRGDVETDAGGKVVRMLGSCVDITERWQAEQAVERNASLLQATLHATADGILVVGTDGKVKAFNDHFLTLWGLPPSAANEPDEILLRDVSDQLEDPAEFLERVHELYHEPTAESRDALRFRDGRVFERYSEPQRIGGNVVGRVWSFRDVTLREQLLRSTLLLADAGRLLWSLDIEKGIEAAARLTIPTLAEACAVDLFMDEGGPRRILSLARDPMEPISSELPPSIFAQRSARVSSGTLSTISVPLVSHEKLLGALTLASRQRRYTDADLELAEKLAFRMALAVDNARLLRRTNEALAARDEFLEVAAHELRGPVSAQHLAVQSLRSGNLPPGVAEKSLEIVEREDRRLTRFVTEIIDMSQARRGNLHFDLGPVDLATVAREAASQLSDDVSRSGSSLKLTLVPGIVGEWDRSRLIQVTTNLLSNALKFGQGRPIEIDVAAGESEARLTVRDYGLGIPKDKQRAIFRPFERVVSGRYYGGLGLGLFIAETIVVALGGRIEVESSRGEGSTFRVVLPFAASK
jgi:PAS domain S-box-containing protein